MENKLLLNKVYKLRVLFTWILVSYFPLVPALFVRDYHDWFDSLAKPPGVPPGWMFSVVWILLYTLMGIAAYLVWSRGLISWFRNEALVFFFLQLGVNSIFTPIYFGLQSLTGGVVVLALLIVLVSMTAFYFWQVSRPAGWIMCLYLTWLFYAFYLNLFIWTLNMARF